MLVGLRAGLCPVFCVLCVGLGAGLGGGLGVGPCAVGARLDLDYFVLIMAIIYILGYIKIFTSL